jgi:hypothetical protein
MCILDMMVVLNVYFRHGVGIKCVFLDMVMVLNVYFRCGGGTICVY